MSRSDSTCIMQSDLMCLPLLNLMVLRPLQSPVRLQTLARTGLVLPILLWPNVHFDLLTSAQRGSTSREYPQHDKNLPKLSSGWCLAISTTSDCSSLMTVRRREQIMSTYVTFWKSAVHGRVPVMPHVMFYFIHGCEGSRSKVGAQGNRPHLLLTECGGCELGGGGDASFPQLLYSGRMKKWPPAAIASIMETHFTLYVCIANGVRWKSCEQRANSSMRWKPPWIRSCRCSVGTSTHSPPTAGQKNAPALRSFLTPSWRLAWMCVSQRFVPMHPDANPNHACRHGQGREGIFNGSLVSFSPRSHHFLRDTEVQKPNAQISPGVNASGCCVSRHWPLADSMRMFFFSFRFAKVSLQHSASGSFCSSRTIRLLLQQTLD